MNILPPGTRVVVVTGELRGNTGAIIGGRNTWGDYVVRLDPEYDPDQLPAAFKPAELETIGD